MAPLCRAKSMIAFKKVITAHFIQTPSAQANVPASYQNSWTFWKNSEDPLFPNSSSPHIPRILESFACAEQLLNKGHLNLKEALRVSESLEQNGIPLSRNFAYCLLQGCTKEKTLDFCRQVDSLVVRGNIDSIAVLGDHLIRLFSSHGSLFEANQAFDRVNTPTMYTWNAVISANIKLEQADMALDLYGKMRVSNVQSNIHIYLHLLKGCTMTEDLICGRLMHEEIIQDCIEPDVLISCALISMYAKCGSLVEASQVFNKMPHKNVVSWGNLIAGYVWHGQGHSALECVKKLQELGLKPEKTTTLSILKACSNAGSIQHGRLMHGEAIANKFISDVAVGSALIDMYAKCGSLEEAIKLIDQLPNRNHISWSAIISAYVNSACHMFALESFQRMQEEGIKPDNMTFSSILKACGGLEAIEYGRLVHHEIIRSTVAKDIILENSLVDMYAKCRSLEEASAVFNKLQLRNVVSWGAMIAGYAQQGHGQLALQFYENMKLEGVEPDESIFSSILKACSAIGAIERGRLVHDRIIETGFEAENIIGSTLIDMYARCGSLEEAQKLLDELQLHDDIVSWSAMIVGYSQCGDIGQVRKCLDKMQKEGIKPDRVAFLSILAACSHAGAIHEACLYFNSMVTDYDIRPDMNHYTCMVDIFSRAGHLTQAEHLLELIQSDIIGWTSLLSACRTYGNVEMGRRCFAQLIRIDCHYAGSYVLLSNIYIDAHMVCDAENIEELRRASGAWKKVAKAWIEVGNKVHEFVVGDRSHPQTDEIYDDFEEIK